jgi:integrase
MVAGQPVRPRDHLFKDVHAYSPVAEESLKRPTIGDLIAFRKKVIADLKLSSRSTDALRIPARLLQEYFGGSRELDTLTRADMHSLFDVLRRIPTRATQRYSGKTILQAIEEADKEGDGSRLATKTLQNYFVQIQTLFSNAVSEGLMKENPTASKLLRRTFFIEEEIAPKAQFTSEELNTLFRTPLYTGCKDDGFGYAKKGINQPRRGRFWTPLLALFHGLRCNEACQILTEDVVTDGEIPFIAIRKLDEEGNQTIKKTKTPTSRRNVPIHPELLRMGFLDYVVKRREDKSSPALFPELPSGHRDYHSDAFSKWFSRFVQNTLGGRCKATFHSFRHQFRDAARDAEMPAESAQRLGGWSVGRGNNSADSYYGKGPRYLAVLARHIAKVNYPGLDLSHLYVSSKIPEIPRSAVGRVRDD